MNGNWYEQPIHKKIKTFTNAQKMAFEALVSYKQLSTRGNAKLRFIINMIKHKRRLENGLKRLASDTRIKKEEAYSKMFSLIETPITYNYSIESYDYWCRNQKKFRTEVQSG